MKTRTMVSIYCASLHTHSIHPKQTAPPPRPRTPPGDHRNPPHGRYAPQFGAVDLSGAPLHDLRSLSTAGPGRHAPPPGTPSAPRARRPRVGSGAWMQRSVGVAEGSVVFNWFGKRRLDEVELRGPLSRLVRWGSGAL